MVDQRGRFDQAGAKALFAHFKRAAKPFAHIATDGEWKDRSVPLPLPLPTMLNPRSLKILAEGGWFLVEPALGEVPTEWEFTLLFLALRQVSHSLSGKGRVKLTSVHREAPSPTKPYPHVQNASTVTVEATFSDFLRNGKKFLFCGISEVASVVFGVLATWANKTAIANEKHHHIVDYKLPVFVAEFAEDPPSMVRLLCDIAANSSAGEFAAIAREFDHELAVNTKPSEQFGVGMPAVQLAHDRLKASE